ncbi:MAG: hypothetical protein JXQ71_10230 [Verrucomicrobia bacterium]|nr:hypothetical protein [Verrucomicrobiota bacterium]
MRCRTFLAATARRAAACVLTVLGMAGCPAPMGHLTATAAAASSPLTWPPRLPQGQTLVRDRTEAFLRPTPTLRPGVVVARTPPVIETMYYPGQSYAGNPWSCWGDGVAVTGRYYSAIGDHLAPGGNAFLYEYDAARRTLRQAVDVRQVLALPDGHYTPGKIHSRLDPGADGWLYFATHRGSPRVTTDAHHYRGDWILRYHPGRTTAEVVAAAPIPRHSIPASVLDPGRLIFYGGTAPAMNREKEEGIRFFAYGVRERKLLYSGPNGPARSLALAPSTGRVYFVPGNDTGALMRFDPAAGGAPTRLAAEIGMRAVTQETRAGALYAVSNGQGAREAMVYSIDTRTERVERLGPAAVGTQHYITSLDADPTGRYLYYVPGAHGGSEQDGCPVVQYDTRHRRRKVIAFLHPHFARACGCTLRGTFSSALSPEGDTLYVTWNNSRGGRAWDSCLLTVIHIPESERAP